MELRNVALVNMLGCVDVAFIDTQRDLRSSVRRVFEARFSGSVSCRPQFFFSALHSRFQSSTTSRGLCSNPLALAATEKLIDPFSSVAMITSCTDDLTRRRMINDQQKNREDSLARLITLISTNVSVSMTQDSQLNTV
jgi:hypothetical protein